MFPKFAIDEPVLIYSRDYPEIQGIEATIISREWNTNLVSSVTGKSIPDSYRYRITPEYGTPGLPWHESSLRKRPSEFSYRELIKSLKQPVWQHIDIREPF